MGILKLVLMEEQKGIVISFFFSCSLPNPWKATDKWRVPEEEHYCKGGGGNHANWWPSLHKCKYHKSQPIITT